MSDFFEDFSDGIEDDAGGLAAIGGLAALNNQRASLKKLSGIQEQLEKGQAASAKTEKERLAIEKQRLKLQQAQIEEQKFTAESIKELRILMADADTLLERMSQMAAAPSGGGDTYDLDLTRTAALIQVKLELVEKNSEVLSDLADLKEQRRLKSHFEKQLSESATLRHLPENPLSFVRKEVFEQLKRIFSVFDLIEELSSGKGLLFDANEIGFEALDGYIISEKKLLSRKQGLTKALERLQTIDQLKIQSEVAGRFTKNHFEESKTLWGQFYFLKGKRPNLDFSGAISYLKRLIDEPQLKEQMEGRGADALATIESHITCARDQAAMLRDAAHRISWGDFELARSAEKIPEEERYVNPLFAENHSRLVQLDTYKDCFDNQIDFSKTHKADLDKFLKRINQAWLKFEIHQWPDDSDPMQRISKNKKTVLEELSKREPKNTMVITVTGLILCLFFCWAFNQGNQQKAAREAEIKALEFTEEKKKAAQAQREAEARAREAARAAKHQRILAERLKETKGE
ncbi:hypothetical protein OAE98_02180 [Akkermansiaceae bacterium]|nr:hypothetical protein [Akkermansiaceae bacterium]